MPRSHSSKSKAPTPAHLPKLLPPPMSSVANPMPTLPSPSFGQTLKEGMAFGAGSAISHRFINSLFGATQVPPKTSSTGSSPCDKERQAFENCMKTQSIDTFCGQEQLAYTSCIRVSEPTSAQ